MATVTNTAALDTLLADPEGTFSAIADLGNTSFTHEALLTELGSSTGWDLDVLSSTLISFSGTSLSGTTDFALAVTGTGMAPIATLADLEQAILDGLATGGLDAITITSGATEILRLDMTTTGYTLSTDQTQINVLGTLPDSFDDISTLATVLSNAQLLVNQGESNAAAGDVISTLASYNIAGFTYFEGTQEIFGIELAADEIAISIEDHTLALNGNFPNLDALDSALNPSTLTQGIMQITDASGAVMGSGGFSVTNGVFTSNDISFTPGTSGEYTVTITSAGGQTGWYGLIAAGFDTDTTSWLELADLPSMADGQTVLAGDGFLFGDIATAGDADSATLSLTAGQQYDFALVDAAANPSEAATPVGITLDTITWTDGSGTQIGVITDIATIDEGLEALEDSWLDPLLDPVELPELSPFIPTAWVVGDPHLMTLDGVGYGFHAAGEYVLMRDTSGSTNFEVQARMAPVGSNASANIAIAARMADGTEVMIDGTDDSPLWIDGISTELADGAFVQVGQDYVFRVGDTYTLAFTGFDDALDSFDTQIAVEVLDGRVDLAVAVDGFQGFHSEGLLGNNDSNPGNDIRLADGTPLAQPLTFDDLYGQYRDDWRVTTDVQSLFTYDAGESVDGFYLPNYPTQIVTVDDFDAGDVTAAEAAAAAAGLVDGTLNFDNAVLDYLMTDGDESFLESSVEAEVLPDTAAAAVDTTGGLTGLNTLSVTLEGGGTDGAEVTFTPAGVVSKLFATPAADTFELKLVNGETGMVEATAEHDRTDAAQPNIGVADALDILRITFGLTPTDGPADGFDFFRADVNRDGTVGVADALDVLRYTFGLETQSGDPSWVYVDANADFSGLTKTNAQFDAADMAIDPIAGDIGLTLTGVLVGNMGNDGLLT